MKRVELIWKSNLFLEYLNLNKEYEKNRIFCHHDECHFLDVARIGTIFVMEHNLSFSKEIIYSCALLHDIGKWQEYELGISHNESSAALALQILKQCLFTDEEIKLIESAILTHRNYIIEDYTLNHILYYADKASRNCYLCTAKKKCNWSNLRKMQCLII